MASWKRPLGTALLVEAIGLGGFFASALLRFSADTVVPALAFKWERIEALLGFLRWLPALQFLGLSLALGAAGGAKDEEGGRAALASRAVVPAVLLSALFSALALVGGPPLEAARSSILASSAAFNRSLDAARSSLEAGDLKRARSEFEICAAISPKDPRIEEAGERIENAELKARREERQAAPATAAEPPPDARTASAYYRKALAYSAKGDNFSAHWYAQTAARLDPSFQEAKRLAAKSWEALVSRGGDDEEASRFYGRKLEGYGLLRTGDPVGAYAIFKSLSAQKPGDPDVRRYLAESLAEAEKAAFFKDEYELSLRGGSIEPAFLSLPSADGRTRLLAAAGASFSGVAAYFRELEYLEADPEGGAPRILVRAPYAKLANGRLFLLCVEREGGSSVRKPSWEAGPASGPSSYLTLDLAPELAYRVLVARSRPASLDILSAWRSLSEAPAYGAAPGPIARDLAARTGIPFALFASGILGALAGARFGRRAGSLGEAFPRRLYALLPLMAAAGLPAYVAATRIDELLAGWASAAFPDLRAIWIAAGVRAALLVAALVIVAGARRDRGGAPAGEP